MSGECDVCGEHAIECGCNSTPWPENWREILDRCPRCDSCGTTLMPRLYCLSQQHPDIEVCHLCSDEYHLYIQKFVDEIKEKKRLRLLSPKL